MRAQGEDAVVRLEVLCCAGDVGAGEELVEIDRDPGSEPDDFSSDLDDFTGFWVGQLASELMQGLLEVVGAALCIGVGPKRSDDLVSMRRMTGTQGEELDDRGRLCCDRTFRERHVREGEP